MLPYLGSYPLPRVCRHTRLVVIGSKEVPAVK
nr:MAG TPA: hypothetical protein [Bacteriophage sp.]